MHTLTSMAMEYAVQRLEMGDVVLIDLPEQEGEIEATVVRPIDRTEQTVRVLLRVEGRDDFVKEWQLGEMVTVYAIDTALTPVGLAVAFATTDRSWVRPPSHCSANSRDLGHASWKRPPSITTTPSWFTVWKMLRPDPSSHIFTVSVSPG